MPIVVSCECGQRFAARDDLAGKTVACPKCKAALTIPAAKAPPAATSTAPIPVTCTCGKRFGAKPELAGKTLRCPSCGAAIAIPAPGQSAATSAPAKGIGDLLDDLGVHRSKTGVRCAKCQSDMPPGAILCLHCGYNHETGQTMQTRRYS